MTKNEFIDYLSKNYDVTKVFAREAVNLFTQGVIDALLKGENVTIAGFGKFDVSEVAARVCNNPQTNELITVEAHNKPTFKYASNVKDSIR